MFAVRDAGEADGPGELHWPFGFSPDLSDLCAYGEVRIPASPAAVFVCLTEICAWARDFTTRDVGIVPSAAALRTESELAFRLDRVPVRAQVVACRPGRCLIWFEHGVDLDVYQEWLLTVLPDGTRVHLGLAARGAAAISYRESDPVGADRTVNRWLAALRGEVCRARRLPPGPGRR
ncbi:hypothetical protein [Streptomyces sp. S.PB5]|uniref:hypothetical protein n=1 Tax=Streptomyces sp. S.PB5 TaxID=3020844 RepID=UPI0025AECFD3|nr:hypothetical protein [Streptomyces sp. S.PB5]MDN3028539.1 hypothetical protein [Streptomyces sp. S.PB5]